MNVPLIDLRAQHTPIRDELLAAVSRVCDSGQFILGPEVRSLENKLSKMLEVPHAIGVSSGTDALLISMMALGVKPGDEVITSAYTFFATAGSIVRLGARPVFVDIDPLTYNVDSEAVSASITARTKAIIPIHLFGLSSDLDPLLESARLAAVTVIEDACQALGARYKDRLVGSMGGFGCFSFFPSKGLGAFGDGGLVVTADDRLAEQIRLLRVHGAKSEYKHKFVGGNFRLDTLQAAILEVKVPHVSTWCENRRNNAARYEHLFRSDGVDNLGVVLPIESSQCYHIYNQYTIRTPYRDQLKSHLESCGIQTAIYYPQPLHLQECFSYLGYREGSFPHAERAAREALALPIYPELSEEQQAYVVGCIKSFLKNES